MDLIVFGGCFAVIAIASRQIGQNLMKTGLPLISGFLFTGILTGPYGLDLITREAVANLRFVDEISLGFIAFAAGGELYVKEIWPRIKSIFWITSGLVVFTFSLASLSFFLMSDFIPFMDGMPLPARIGVSILAGAILVARSPSSAIAIVNELRAKGPFTQTVLGVTIIMDVVVIVLFAFNSSMADALFSGMRFSFGFVLLLIVEISISLAAGWLVSRILMGLLCLAAPPIIKAAMVLLTGFSVFIGSAQIREISHGALGVEILLEPLLICMVAGFLVANIRRLRSEFLSLLHRAGPPVYIAFFTLTGASLSLDVLALTWPIAIALFLVRVTAIFLGTFTGGTLAGNPVKHNTISWMAFITQAGVGLGLAKEVVVEFPEWGDPFATIIISVIVINQLIGPPLFKSAIKLVKEDHLKAKADKIQGSGRAVIFGDDSQAAALAISLMSQEWRVSLATLKPVHTAPASGPDIPRHPLAGLSVDELKRAGCQEARAIVTLMSDQDNLKICETAYEHFGTQTLITRLNDRKHLGSFQALGVLIVDPATAMVSLLDHFVRAPSTASLLLGMQQRVTDLPMMNPDLAGLALRDLRLPLDLLIMSVRRRGVQFVPHDYTRLEAGDMVTVIGPGEAVKELALRFGVNREEALLNLVEKVRARDLNGQTVQSGVKALISGAEPKKSDRFDNIVESSRVMDLEEPMTKEQFFHTAARSMSDRLKVPADRLYELLSRREDEMTTVLAPGLAVPHIIIEGEKKVAMLLARCRRGIEFADGAPLSMPPSSSWAPGTNATSTCGPSPPLPRLCWTPGLNENGCGPKPRTPSDRWSWTQNGSGKTKQMKTFQRIFEALKLDVNLNRAPEGDLVQLAQKARLMAFNRGETIFMAGETADPVYLVESGKVILSCQAPSGKAFTFLIAVRGMPLNAVTCFKTTPRYFSARVAEQATVVAISSPLFKQWVLEHPQVTAGILDTLGTLLEGTYTRIMDLIDQSAETRILNALTMLTNRIGPDLPLTNADVAEITGVSRETAARVISHLQRLKLISKSRGAIKIVDKAQLQELSTRPFFIL